MRQMPSLPSYPTDLNDLEWAVVDKTLGGPPKLGRPPRFERRAVLGAIFYMVRTGGSWRLLPHDLPPRRIVHCCFALWRAAGLFEKLHGALRDAARIKGGNARSPCLRNRVAETGVIRPRSRRSGVV